MTSEFFIHSLAIKVYGHLRLTGSATMTPGVNLLIGRNGSGKTTILNMIRSISKGDNPFLLTNDDLLYLGGQTVAVSIGLQRAVGDQTTIERYSDNNPFSNQQALHQRVRFVTSNRSLRNELKLKSMFANVNEFSMSEPGDEINVSDEFAKALNSELIERLRTLDVGLEGITQAIEADYREGLVDLDKNIHLDFERDNPVYFVDHLDREISINQLSAGEQELLYFFAYLRRIRNDSNMVILIDEPELHLHGTQIRKLCDMLAALALQNQVIIATHSSDVLHYFMRSGNIVLLAAGEVRRLDVSDDMALLVEQLGLPVDPSVFTAHWIVAENDEAKALPGPEAPNTVGVLRWMFGKDLHRRYWSFGSNRLVAERGLVLLSAASTDLQPIRVSVILDGDRLVAGLDSWPPAIDAAPTGRVVYLPLWEIENVFLSPAILGLVSEQVGFNVEDRLWEVAQREIERLAASAAKTIVKIQLQRMGAKYRIDAQPVADLAAYVGAVADLTFDEVACRSRTAELIDARDWRWLPGKELFAALVNDVQGFWNALSAVDDERIQNALRSTSELGPFLEHVGAVDG